MSQKNNLFDLAGKNSGRLKALYETCVSGATKSGLATFADFVQQNGKISIHFRPAAMTGFLTTGRHLNAYERAEMAAKGSGLTRKEELERHQGKYYAKRSGFDAAFESGEDFRYGALNAGGMGARHYGEYCVVLKGEFPETAQEIAYIKDDSLSYVDSAGNVDVAQLEKNLAMASHKGQLAAIKHENEIPTSAEVGWPALLCSDTYIEAVFLQSPTPVAIDRVRISVQDRREYMRLAYKARTTELDETERKRSRQYMEIRKLLQKKNILSEGV